MIRQPLLFALLGGLLCASPWLEAAGPGQMPALVLEQFVDGQWQTPTRVVEWGKSVIYTLSTPAVSDLNGVVTIAAGARHTVGLKIDGTVIAWGENGYGQTTIPAGLSDIVAVAAGFVHTVVLKNDGTVLAWGSNFHGQTRVPAGLTNVIAIAAGTSHSVALKSDGTVVAWGNNYNGQINVPAGLTNVVAIAAGDSHTAALKSDGRIVVWGDNPMAQTWLPSGLGDVVAMAAGYLYTMVLKSDGSIAIHRGSYGLYDWPEDVSGVVSIAAGSSHGVALKSDGRVVGWGDNHRGQIDVPTGLTSAVSIAANDDHTVALTSTVEIDNRTIGSTSFTTLRLTNPSSTHTLTGLRLELPVSTEGQFSSATPLPSTLAPGESAEITIRYSQGTLEDTAGWLQFFGDGETSPLAMTKLQVSQPKISLFDIAGRSVETASGNGLIGWGFRESSQPGLPTGLNDVVAISASDYRTAALLSDGSVLEWGNEGKTTQPAGLSNIVAIAVGNGHTVALKNDGKVVAWRYSGPDNNYGQATVPANLESVIAIAAGSDHTVALKSDGKVVAWGDNRQGQTKVPANLKGVIAIAAGARHTVALKRDGKVVAWGDNRQGQTNLPSWLDEVVAIAAGDEHTVTLQDSGRFFEGGDILSWGSPQGHLYANAGHYDAVAIAAGGSYTIGIDTNGTVISQKSYMWNDPRNDPHTVPASLNGVTAIAAASDYAVALIEMANQFPSVQLEEHRDHTFILKNTGLLTLKQVNAVIEGPDASQFSLPPPLPATFAVGAQSPFTLRFTPTRVGPINATLKVYSNAPDSPFVLPLSGAGHFEVMAEKNYSRCPFIYYPLRQERQTGLVVQHFGFYNDTGYPLKGLRLVLSRVPAGLTVYSSSAGKVPGTLEVLYTKAIAPNDDITFDLVYHDPKRRATASIQPVIKAQALEQAVPTPGPVTGTNVPLLRVQKLAQGPALEWNSKAGSTYVVEYSDDAGKTWSSAVHRLTSRGTRLFWIDRGQPETFSAPIVGTRSYRVKRL